MKWNLLNLAGLLCAGLFCAGLICLFVGCDWIIGSSQDLRVDDRVVSQVRVEDLPKDLELFASVFWEPDDTASLRKVLRESPELVAGKAVLDIGTGSGLVALCCAQAEAASVTATDVNPEAVECARHNARRLGFTVDVRHVEVDDANYASAFSAFGPEDRFDVILSNPPWEDGKPQQWAEHALYDPDFKLLRSIIVDAKQHLNPNGRILLAYGCVDAIRAIHRLAAENGYRVVVFDDRDLDSLPAVFLPGMLVGLLPDTEL